MIASLGGDLIANVHLVLAGGRCTHNIAKPLQASILVILLEHCCNPGLEKKGARRHADAMVEFDLQLFGDPRLFGLIAAHGFVDFASPSLLAVYALAAVPLGSIPTTAGFLALSLLHFGRDLGPALSLGMHSLVGLVYLLDQNVAFSLMMAYSLVYHIPGRAAFLESATSGGGCLSPSPLAL